MKSSLSSEDVVRVTEDLSDCRTRLDASVEDNRRNRQVIQEINEQLSRYRQRAAQDDASSAHSLQHHGTSMPALIIDIPLNTSTTIHSSRPMTAGFYRNNRHRSLIPYRYRSTSPAENARNRSSPADGGIGVADVDSYDEMLALLKDELLKNNTLAEVNEMLREENDAALAANEHLRVDATTLTQQLQVLQQQQHMEAMRFRAENTRYRNQVENQNRKLISLWKEFTAVKRQLHDLKTSTANDLDKQVTEFTRCANLMRKAIRHSEQKNLDIREQMKREKDEVLDDTLRQLKAVTDNYMKSDEKAVELSRELRKKEEEVRKLKEKAEEYDDILVQLSKMTYEMAGTGGGGKRARSQSPSDIVVRSNAFRENPMEVARKMRRLLNAKNGEIDETKEMVRQAEKDKDRLKKDLEKEEKKRKEERESDRKRSSLNSIREAEMRRLEDELKKSNEKIRNLEEQMESQEKLTTSVQNSLSEAHRLHKDFIEELMFRHRDELKERELSHGEQMKQRDTDEKARFEKERSERDKYRKENDELREIQRNLKADMTAIRTDSEDRKMVQESVEKENEQLKGYLEKERELADSREAQLEECRVKLDELQEKEVELRRELAETQATVIVMEGDSKQNEEQFLETKNEVATLTEQIENLTMEMDAKTAENVEMRKNIEEREVMVQTIRSESHQYAATCEEANGQIEMLKIELTRMHDEMMGRTKLVAEANEKFDDAMRKCDMLTEDVNAWQDKFEQSKKELAELNSRAQIKEQEEAELRALLEDLRSNFDKLTNELKQKCISNDSMTDEIIGLKEQLVKMADQRKEEIGRMEENEKKMEMEMKEEYDGKIRIKDKERDEMEKMVEEVDKRLNELTKIHEMLMEEHDQLKVDHMHTTEDLEKAKEKMKKELEKANDQNESDRMEWNNERQRMDMMKNEMVRELQENIARLEDEMKEWKEKEMEMKKELEDLKEEVREKEEVVKRNEREAEEKEEDRQKERKSANEEKLKLVEAREEALLLATKHSSTMEQQTRRIHQLEGDIEKLMVNVTDRESNIHALESNTMELITKIEEGEKEAERMKDEIAMMVKQNSELKSGKEGLNDRWMGEKKMVQELGEQVRELSKSLHNIRMKNVNLEEKKAELEQSNTVLSNKVKHMEIQLMDKSAKNEVSGDLLRKMEHDAQSMLKQAQNEQFKVTDLEKVRKALQEENQRLVSDLATVKAAFEAKRESSKSAIGDILEKYRQKANNGEMENQRLRSEVQNYAMKLKRNESKTRESEEKVRDSQKRYEDAQSRLIQLQRSAVESLQNPTNPKNRSLYVEIPRAASSLALNDTVAFDELPLRRSPSVRFAGEAGRSNIEAMDVSSSVGVTLRFLKERVEQLEGDKAELGEVIEKLKEDLREKGERLADRQMIIERVERQLIHITEERNTIENRMSSQRQMYLTNEESSRSREQELRSLKARISTLELHLREKESKMTHLKKEIEILHGQLHDANESKDRANVMVGGQEMKYREMEESLDRIVREKEQEKGKSRRLQVENENVMRKMEQMDKDREQLMRELNEERKMNERARIIMDELRMNEKNLKNVVVNVKKTAEERERNVVEQRRWEESHVEMANRNQALSRECERLRDEMREQLGRMNAVNLKSVDNERKNEELSSKLLTLANTVASLKKFEEEWRRLEAEMSAELKVLRKEKLVHTAEIEDLKRKGLRSDTERKEIEGIRIRLEREISALKRHVDALEEEKGRTEKAVKDTMAERRAIDKSLASMERENQQLYRNCAQLQSQIQQLERDAGNRSVAKLAKEHMLLEARINALIEEKKQLQSMLEQRDANHSHKRKMLESQIQLLREQLEAERRKRTRTTSEAGGGRRGVVHTSAFRRTIEHSRSISMDRTTRMEQQYECHQQKSIIWRQTPPTSPLSHSDSFTSGTLIM